MTDKKFTTFDHTEADRHGKHYWAKWIARHHDSTIDQNQESEEFRLILPPANITGVLHLGHAITVTIEDVMARYHMLTGKRVRWIPGTDHAGIATQVVVEKDLRKEKGLSRHDLGREAFLQRVWDWKSKSASTIISQLKQLSPLLDYDNEQFTMNLDLSEEVTRAFVELYRKGKVFRGERMIDYCCELQTSISNIEIEHIEITGPTKHTCPNNVVAEVGQMYDIAYEIDPSTLPDGINIESIVISTTRPETMFGDVCVAVHPDDKRYRNLQGIRLRIPFTNITIPLIYDSVLPNPEMGTGALKVTPAHDPKDYDMYCRRRSDSDISGLYEDCDFVEVIDDQGLLNFTPLLERNSQALPDQTIEKLGGRNRYIGRKILIKMLEESNYLREVRPHKTTLNVCSRTGDILEPKLRSQWFVETADMCRRSLEAVENGDLQILGSDGKPSKIHAKTWTRFLEDGRPWCISRQLWWGHRIPAYQIRLTDPEYSTHPIQSEWIVAENESEAHKQAKSMLKAIDVDRDFILYQDPDVLDTWFSSGIYPFSIMSGSVFPQNILETGKDILFFWVARMVMLSLELRGELPFTKVFLHNMVRDKEGRKMSKSLGNVIDPLDVIYGIDQKGMIARIDNSNLLPKEKAFAIKNIKKHFPQGIKSYGVDSLRLGLLYYMRQDSDINLNIDIFKSAHALLNKVWQIMNLYDILSLEVDNTERDLESVNRNIELTEVLMNWIDTKESEFLDFRFYETYNLSELYDRIYSYVMNYFAPSYLEAVKTVLTDKTDYYRLSTDTCRRLFDHLKQKVENIILFLHPMAPNVTLQLAERIGLDFDTVRQSNYISDQIEHSKSKSETKENRFDHVLEVISTINSSKNKKTSRVYWYDADDRYITWAPIVSHLTRVGITFVLSPSTETYRIECFESTD